LYTCSNPVDGALTALEATLDALAAADEPVDDRARLDRVLDAREHGREPLQLVAHGDQHAEPTVSHVAGPAAESSVRDSGTRDSIGRLPPGGQSVRTVVTPAADTTAVHVRPRGTASVPRAGGVV
jgi:hypothetical protein